MNAQIDTTDPWRGLYLAERLSPRCEYGQLIHPDLPTWPDDREEALDKLVRAQGFDFVTVAGDFTDEALENGDELYWGEMRAWNPEAPEGDWRLAWMGDTEDGPYAWFVRPMALRPEVVDFQAGVADWARKCFERPLYRNMTERGDRLLEEVLELLQSKGYDSARVRTLVDYVYARPVGEPVQEVGGVMVTLAAFCSVAGLNMKGAGDAELERIAQPEVMEKIRAKQELKNAIHFDTPLPGDAGRAATGKQSLQLGEVQEVALSTSEGARRYVADFFTRELRRHDFGRYITTTLAADFASALAQYLAARHPMGKEPVEMRICELRHVSLKPNRPYVFTVDANCANCRADAAYAMGHTDTSPTQAVDLGQFRECVELMEWQERGHANPDFPVGDPKKHAEALRLLALIDGQAVGNG